MRKKYIFASFLLATCLTVTGCDAGGIKIEEAIGVPASNNYEILYSYSPTDIPSAVATDFRSLVKASDFIAEVHISATESYLGDDGIIYTAITPDVSNIFKGELNDEKIVVPGGYVTGRIYSESATDSNFEKTEYDDYQLDADMVYCNYGNNHVPSEGETILYFGTKTDDATYTVTGGWQGDFVLYDTTYENPSLDASTGAVEQLTAAFLQISDSTRVKPAENTCTYSGVLAIPQEKMLNCLCDYVSEA